MKAIKNNNLKLIKKLLKDPRVNPSIKNNYPICFSSLTGLLEVVKELLKDSRVDPSADNNYPIRYASEKGHLEVVKVLLKDLRVDPSRKKNYAIRNASKNGHLEVVKELLKDLRVDPSKKNDEAIRNASFAGHLEIIKELLKDKRIDWRRMSDEIQFIILKEERNILKKELVVSYFYLEKIFPQIKIGRLNKEGREEIVTKSRIPKSIIKKIIYLAFYQELCSIITSNIPPIKLVALANILKITYDNISLNDLSYKVKQNILL